MTESYVTKDINSSQLASIVKGYFIKETPKSLLFRILDSISFWVPKRFIDSQFSNNSKVIQDFIIEDWILRKIGLISQYLKLITHYRLQVRMKLKKIWLLHEIIDKNPGLTVDELHQKVKWTRKKITRYANKLVRDKIVLQPKYYILGFF